MLSLGLSITSPGVLGGGEPAPPPVTGLLLLEDNASFVLLEDGVSRIEL